jgi:hypothetical protein
LAPSWSPAQRLGAAATFNGRIAASRDSGRWKLNVSGLVTGIELDSLLAVFPHKLTGTANLTLQHATIEDGRLAAVAGTLAAGPGTISRSLIHSAQDSLALAVSRQAFLDRTSRLPDRRLEMAFDVDASGLSLHGRLPQSPGALLVDDVNVLAREPAIERQPVVNLLRALVPQTAVQVPATQETSGLAAFLPIPPIVPPPGSEAPLPQARAIKVEPR